MQVVCDEAAHRLADLMRTGRGAALSYISLRGHWGEGCLGRAPIFGGQDALMHQGAPRVSNRRTRCSTQGLC